MMQRENMASTRLRELRKSFDRSDYNCRSRLKGEGLGGSRWTFGMAFRKTSTQQIWDIMVPRTVVQKSKIEP
jgi:hypothetical protein